MKISFLSSLFSNIRRFSRRFLPVKTSAIVILDQLIELNYLLAVFLVPLWFAYFFPSFNIFELNKIIIFRFLVWSLFLLTSFRIIFFPINTIFSRSAGKDRWLIFKRYFSIPVLLVIGSFAALFFSLDYQQSFFGSYERQQGVASYFFYFLWSLLIFINLSIKSNLSPDLIIFKSKIKKLLVAAVASAAIVSIYGILQILNLDFISWPEQPYLTGRAFSSFGQPNFLASFLLLTIPLSIYLFYVSRHFFSQTVYLIITGLQLICLFLTASRGGLLAFAVVVMVFIVYLFFISGLKYKIKWLAIGIAILIVGLGFFIIEMITPGRWQGSLNFRAGSLVARVNSFQAAAGAIIDKPFFGYGPENSSEVFIQYYERDWAEYSDVGTNTDRAHNIVLDILLNLGFFGLLLFGIWYYSFFKLAFREFKKKINWPLALTLTLGASGYLISLLFSFSIVVTEIYFWLFFAILAALNFQSEKSLNAPLIEEQKIGATLNGSNKKVWLKLLLVLLIFSIFIFQILKNIEALLADAYLNDVYVTLNYVALNKDNLALVLLRYDQINRLNINQVQKEFSVSFIGDNLSSQYDKIKDPVLKNEIRVRLENIFQTLPEQGYYNIFLKAKISSQLEDYSVADKYFSLIHNLAPNWPLAYLEEARSFVQRGNFEKAEEAYRLVDFNLPDLNNKNINDEHRASINSYKYIIYNSLGDIYFTKQDYYQAEKFFQAAYKSSPVDYSILKKIADTYYLQGDLVSAIKYVAHGAQLSPTDYNWPLALSILYFEQGDRDKALMFITAAIALAPEREDLKKIQEKYKD